MILSVASAMATNGLLSVGYDHIMLDDCWAWTARDAGGALQADPSRFPRGMAWLASTLRAQGFSMGLYTSVGPTTCVGGASGARTATVTVAARSAGRRCRKRAHWHARP